MARLLLVDDSPDILVAVGRLLRERGHFVTCTNSGADAVCLLKHKPPPDLLILDVRMPVMDGYEVIATLGPTAPPVIVITGSDLSPAEVAGARVTRVLAKPFDGGQLISAVNDVLAQAAAAASDG